MTQAQAGVLALQVIDFDGIGTLLWRRSVPNVLAREDDLTFAKAMTPIGSHASAGSAAGVPDLRRQVLLSVCGSSVPSPTSWLIRWRAD